MTQQTLLITGAGAATGKEAAFAFETITNLIVKAVEANKPKARYIAPLKYKLIIYLQRLIGK